MFRYQRLSSRGRGGSSTRLVFALAALVAASPLVALEGRVVASDGSPLPNHQVSVVGRSVSARTSADGTFRIEPSPLPPFELLVIAPDGRSSEPVAFDRLVDGQPIEIRLPDVLLDTITVLSGVAPHLETPPAAAMLTLNQSHLAQRLPERLADVVEGIPGASRSEEGLSGVPSLRGMARGRTLVLLDGARLTTERRAGTSATFLNPFTLGSVEVGRGASSVVYGSDAFGGVIDARPRYPEPGPLRVRFDVSQTLLAGDDLGGGIELQRSVGGSGALLIAAQAREGHDSEDGNGEGIFNSSYRDHGFAVRWASSLRVGSLRLAIASDEVHDLGKPDTDSRVTRTYYPIEVSNRLNAGFHSGPVGGFSNLELALFAHHYRLVTDRDRFATGAANRSIERADNESDDLVLRASAERPLFGGRLLAGFDGSSRTGLDAVVDNISFDAAGNQTAVRSTVAINHGSRTDLGLFATWDRTLAPRLALAIGARGDEVESRTSGGIFGSQSVDDGTFSGQVGLTAGPFADTVVTAQVARGFRVPTLSDRFFVGPSGRGMANGNPDLEPETSNQIDTAVRWSRSGRSFSFYAYRYEIKNLIERFRVGNDFYLRNRGEARIEGVEFESQLALTAELGLELGAAYSRGETPEDGIAVNDIAAPSLVATLRWQRQRVHAFLRGASYLEDDEPGPSEVVRDGYTMLDLGGGFAFRPGFEIRLLGRNLADTTYHEAGDAIAPLSKGRTVSVGLVGKL